MRLNFVISWLYCCFYDHHRLKSVDRPRLLRKSFTNLRPNRLQAKLSKMFGLTSKVRRKT
ncbi:hypothetical protein GCWU000325_02830 [Alloprevotella tannerae ATCC 51259]|uniref:Uncharacterized protein n=1 Tax=Alloprevotella tannerae ATCC 51259 TaxID=626522 RepID=C9LKQ9_9BACT|nr:hypothetical protein GCWU000325_02830 [Alloprevotella tannerae ATCC 51259]